MKGNLGFEWSSIFLHHHHEKVEDITSLFHSKNTQRERSKSIINGNCGVSKKGKWASIPANPGKRRGERWQPIEGRTERGERREKLELLPITCDKDMWVIVG